MTSPALLESFSRDTMIWLTVTIILGGAGAFATGRALARAWRGLGRATFYAGLLAGLACFLSYALFHVAAIPLQAIATAVVARDFSSLPPLLAVWAVTFVLLALFAALGWRLTRARMLRQQYGCLAPRQT